MRHQVLNLVATKERSFADKGGIPKTMSEIHRPITSRLIAKKKAFIGPEILNRYTSLPIALDVLSQKRITLLSPETWEDRNDAYYLERYRVKKELCCVLAICFSIRPETFHHWRVFSSGSAGVCI